MDRYNLFQKLLALVADEFKVTDAKMKNYCDNIMIEGTSDSGEINIEVRISERDNT